MVKKNSKILKKENNRLEIKTPIKINPFNNRIITPIKEEQDKEETESSELESIVNISTPKYPVQNNRNSPMLELSEETQLETSLKEVPTANQATENAAEPDNNPGYVQGSSSLYQPLNYDSNSKNYNDTSGYPKMISAPEFLNKGPNLGFSTSSSNPSLGLRSSNNLASNEYPGMMQDESKKYEPVSGQKPNKRRY
ncbi:MAG: hypothetical protein WC979_06055 [Candidatus Pacearchaeota archaeon]|jgi:hypothetical protein